MTESVGLNKENRRAGHESGSSPAGSFPRKPVPLE